MVQRYDFDYNNKDSDCMTMHAERDGDYVEYDDYTALEQRFDALSTKFSALVEENATLRKRLEEMERMEGR